ncbi:MAG: hypothetical protein JNL38_31360 [Myxococcales bacterium]|jgi:hypothetical protein|nr:hypothetical protein [Myxococcales bacterium]
MRLKLWMASAVAASLVVVACGDDSGNLGGGSSGGGSSSGDPAPGSDPAGTSSSSSGGSSSSGASGSSGGSSGVAQLCVDTINQYRAKLGRPAYKRWEAAESCSNDQAKSDATTKKAHGAFGKCGEFAQNECPGWSGPAETMITGCLKSMWGEGPGGGHYENMAATKYTQVACGFYVLPNGSVWSVQNFK